MSIVAVFDFLPPVKKFVVIFVVKKTKVFILLRKYGSGGWDRTYRQSVIPGHKVSYLYGYDCHKASYLVIKVYIVSYFSCQQPVSRIEVA